MKVVDRELTALRELALRMGACAEAILAKSWRVIRERSADGGLLTAAPKKGVHLPSLMRSSNSVQRFSDIPLKG